METRLTRAKPAFTLVELLVVVAVIGTLVALLLPAIQAARESARRATCGHHLRQIATAAMLHESAHRFLPSGGWGDRWVGCPDRASGADQPGGWAYQLLDYLEQGALRRLGIDAECGAPESAAALSRLVARPLATFHCPSRRAARPYPLTNRGAANFDAPRVAGKSDYAANLGDLNFFTNDGGPSTLAGAATHDWAHSGSDFTTRYAEACNCRTGHTGVVFQRSQIAFRQITDGVSRTYLIGEKNLDPDHYEDGGVGNDDQCLYTGHDQDNLRSTYSISLFVGAPVLGAPPAPDTPGVSSKRAYSFGGPHPGVWMIAFCDGSTRALSYDMDRGLHRWFGNRLDGEATDSAFD